MNTYPLPYGKTHLALDLPAPYHAEVIAPAEVPGALDPLAVVETALDVPVDGLRLARFAGARSAAIAINDKTRPVPHDRLLPSLLNRLGALGLPPKVITLIIATGTHPPMPPGEFEQVVPPALLEHYPVICHDAADDANLVHLGETARGTPVWINKAYMAAELRIVVGNIEPHQFMGFSGGVKSAAIGLAGKATVNRNHSLLSDPDSRLGHYEHNPARQDVEEMGQMIGVHFALNAILNGHKQIVHAVAGSPGAVMQAGIPLARQIAQVPVAAPFDLVIASPGGHPKDINVYQAQKALAHAALITRPGGTVILTAACPEGSGSATYEGWMAGVSSYEAVFEKFAQEGFRAGPHKAFQIARDAARLRVLFVSEMPAALAEKLLLPPTASLTEALRAALDGLPGSARIGVMPYANATVPVLAG